MKHAAPANQKGVLVRWLFSLASACYIVAALALVPAWLHTARLSAAAQWAAYIAVEIAVLGALVLFAVRWLIERAGGGREHVYPPRLFRLAAMALAPLFGLLVVPVGCFVFIGGTAGTIAGAGVFAVSIIALLGASVYGSKTSR